MTDPFDDDDPAYERRWWTLLFTDVWTWCCFALAWGTLAVFLLYE